LQNAGSVALIVSEFVDDHDEEAQSWRRDEGFVCPANAELASIALTTGGVEKRRRDE
jgi:hypothetical protein